MNCRVAVGDHHHILQGVQVAALNYELQGHSYYWSRDDDDSFLVLLRSTFKY